MAKNLLSHNGYTVERLRDILEKQELTKFMWGMVKLLINILNTKIWNLIPVNSSNVICLL